MHILKNHELVNRFEIIFPNNPLYSDLRAAYIDSDIAAILRLAKHGIDPDILHNIVLGRCTWNIYQALAAIDDTAIVESIKGLHGTSTDWDKDAMSQGQLKSKMWVVNEVKRLELNLGTVFMCAGWYAMLAVLFREHNIPLKKVRSFDIDDSVRPIAHAFNLPWIIDAWKFQSVTADIHNIDYGYFEYDILDGDQVVATSDTPDTIINTSCEHIENFDEWYAKIPGGKLVILQSNNFEEIDEHTNLSTSIGDFAEETPLAEELYSGELELPLYTRFMRIGIK